MNDNNNNNKDFEIIGLTRDNLARIRNMFCQELHTLALRQTLMVQNYMEVVRTGRTFDVKIGTKMPTSH